MTAKARKCAPRPSPASTSAAILNVLERINLRLAKMDLGATPASKHSAPTPATYCNAVVFKPRYQHMTKGETMNYYKVGFDDTPGRPCGTLYIPKHLARESLVLRFEPLCP